MGIESEMLHKTEFEQDKKLAQELERLKREELVGQKHRQYLRNTCQELKELEAKLRAAYTSKELHAQLAEKELAKMEEKMRQQNEFEILQANYAAQKEREEKMELEALIRKVEYRKELQDQLIVLEKDKQKAYHEFLEDKKIIDAITSQIYEEDLRAEERKIMNMQKTKKEVEEFFKQREEWKNKEKEAMEAENRRLMEYAKQQEQKKAYNVLAQREKEEKKTAMINKMAREVYDRQMKKQEEEDIVQELLEAREREKSASLLKEQFEKKLRMRIELRQMQHQQTEIRLAKLEQEALEERYHKEQLLQKFAEDEKLAQLTTAKQRLMKMEYRRSIEEMLQVKRKERTEEHMRLLRLHEDEKKQKEDMRKMVEEERLRMLKEHATELIGFLPRGVLREDDLPHLGSDFLEKYSRHAIQVKETSSIPCIGAQKMANEMSYKK